MKTDLKKYSVQTRYYVDGHVDGVNVDEYQIDINQMAKSGSICVMVDKWVGEKYKPLSIQHFDNKTLSAAKAHARDIITVDRAVSNRNKGVKS